MFILFQDIETNSACTEFSVKKWLKKSWQKRKVCGNQRGWAGAAGKAWLHRVRENHEGRFAPTQQISPNRQTAWKESASVLSRDVDPEKRIL
jgi:hypothetical protein